MTSHQSVVTAPWYESNQPKQKKKNLQRDCQRYTAHAVLFMLFQFGMGGVGGMVGVEGRGFWGYPLSSAKSGTMSSAMSSGGGYPRSGAKSGARSGGGTPCPVPMLVPYSVPYPLSSPMSSGGAPCPVPGLGVPSFQSQIGGIGLCSPCLVPGPVGGGAPCPVPGPGGGLLVRPPLWTDKLKTLPSLTLRVWAVKSRRERKMFPFCKQLQRLRQQHQNPQQQSHQKHLPAQASYSWIVRRVCRIYHKEKAGI